MDWSIFWTAVGSVAAALAVVAPAAIAISRWFRRQIGRDIELLRDENRRLREDLETRLRIPSFSLDAIRLTEMAAERRIDDLTQQLNQAIAVKNEELAGFLGHELREAEELRHRVEALSNERDELQARLQNAVSVSKPPVGGNGIGLQTGLILLVHHKGKYAAIQAVEQSTTREGREGNYVRYAWWYQPDGSGVFTNKSAIFGTGHVHEGGRPLLQVGPIQLAWSAGGKHFGWVYFGPQTNPSSEYELAQTMEIDIARIDATDPKLMYLRRP